MKLLLSLCLLPALLYGQASEETGLKLTLMSESLTIVPGEPLTVGLHIQHEPDFHTYWKNPGIVGIATILEWELPPGFTASEISWPYPELCDMAGHPCHGYEREVTLLTTITPLAQIEASEITLRAVATWMCCAKTCHPGNKPLQLTLPVSTHKQPHSAAIKLLSKATREIPKPDPNWSMTTLSQKDQSPLKLSFTTTNDDEPQYFFSSDGQISSDQPQKFITSKEPKKWTLTIPRSKFASPSQSPLRGVLKTKNGLHLLLVASQ